MAISMDTDALRDATVQLLGRVGIDIEHAELTALMLAKGCSLSASGRVLIPEELISEMADDQKLTQAEDADDQQLMTWCGPDWAHWLMWTGQKAQVRERMKTEFLMSAFDCGPTQYFDYPSARLLPVNTDIFVEMKKLAEATPEIGYVSTWYRQDVPQPTERISSLILGLQHTSKVDGIEAIDPAMMKYLVQIGEVMTGNPGESRYLAGSQCLISPLILDHRASEDIMERHRIGADRYHAASMPTIGISTPVTVASSIVIGAAEILGCMIAAWCVCPDGDLTGRMISTVADMRTADASSGGPENLMVILGVRKLFEDHFGGHVWAETYFSPSTNRPGLHAVYQNFYAAAGRARLTGDPDMPYPGMGTLDIGGVGSPTQLMLDIEIRKSQFALKSEIEVSEATLLFDEVCEHVDTGETFLTSEHTLDHFRELWTSELFPLSVPEIADDLGDEKRILDSCDERWRANVANWQPPELADDTLRELEGVLARADEELL